MGLTVVTPPPFASRVVSLDAVKAYLRVDDSSQDETIGDMVDEAQEWLEGETQQQLFTAVKQLTLDRFPRAGECFALNAAGGVFQVQYQSPAGYVIAHGEDRQIVLPTPPLQAVSGVAYTWQAAPVTLDPSLYTVDAASRPGRIMLNGGQVWPATDDVANAVTVTFTCGYGATCSTIPKRFATAIKWLTAHMYENREAVSEVKIHELPIGLNNLIQALMFRYAYGA